MKIILITFLLAISFYVASQSSDTIYWSPSNKLVWSDFTGTPDYKSNQGAISYCGITYSLSYNKFGYSFNVSCYFNKVKSWVSYFSNIGLIHEQGHFDIAELFARKLRQAFENYNFNQSTVKEDFKNIYNDIIMRRAKFDNQYDTETNFSLNKIKQLGWNQKILLQLDSLHKYQSQ